MNPKAGEILMKALCEHLKLEPADIAAFSGEQLLQALATLGITDESLKQFHNEAVRTVASMLSNEMRRYEHAFLKWLKPTWVWDLALYVTSGQVPRCNVRAVLAEKYEEYEASLKEAKSRPS